LYQNSQQHIIFDVAVLGSGTKHDMFQLFLRLIKGHLKFVLKKFEHFNGPQE
jgi:hypothetical protein